MYKQLKRLTVYEKTGFHNATGNRVRLLDKRGIVFYDTGELNHPVFEFNLPAGEYFIESGRFSKMARPVNFPLLPLDNYDRPTKRGNPDLFKLVFEDNPATAQIDWTAKTIYFDNSLKDASLPVLNLILEHEYAHKYYGSEDSCDRMAYNQMIERGYNPSQIGFAFDDTITNRSCERVGTDIISANSKRKKLDSFDSAHPDFANQTFTAQEIKDHAEYLRKNLIGERIYIQASSKGASVYSTPGGTLMYKIKPGETIGKVKAINSTGNWAYLENDVYNPNGGAVSLNIDSVTPVTLTKLKPESVTDAVTREVPNAVMFTTGLLWDLIKTLLPLIISGIVVYIIITKVTRTATA